MHINFVWLQSSLTAQSVWGAATEAPRADNILALDSLTTHEIIRRQFKARRRKDGKGLRGGGRARQQQQPRRATTGTLTPTHKSKGVIGLACSAHIFLLLPLTAWHQKRGTKQSKKKKAGTSYLPLDDQTWTKDRRMQAIRDHCMQAAHVGKILCLSRMSVSLPSCDSNPPDMRKGNG